MSPKQSQLGDVVGYWKKRKIYSLAYLLIHVRLHSSGAQISFLKDVSFVYDDKSRYNKVVLCKSLPNSECEISSESTGCSAKGSLHCYWIPNEEENAPILSQYEKNIVEFVNLTLSDSRKFGIYVIPNDTVSTHLRDSGTFAPILTALVNSITRDACEGSSDHPKLVVDLGCNLGLISLIALANGCEVICVEPIDMLIPTIIRSMLWNRFNGTAVVLHAAAGDTWHEVTVTSCGAACDDAGGKNEAFASTDTGSGSSGGGGGLALAWGEVRPAAPGRGRTMSVPLGEHLRGRALLVKMDVEGYEWAASQGLNRWLADYGFDHLLVEAKYRPAATLAALLQGCGDRRPHVRAWKERYYGPVESWDPARLPLVDIDMSQLRGAGPLHYEDFWVTCEPESES